MSSTYLSLHYHLVFSTKHRVPVIREASRNHCMRTSAGPFADWGRFRREWVASLIMSTCLLG